MHEVEGKIVEVRGQKALLDRDVAAVYGVETKRVNEAVRNNPRKFPEGYVFELTGEESAEKGVPFINYPKLHRQISQKEYFRAQATHEPTKFKGDYTQVPRGRVAWNIDKFIVLVGKWAEPIQDELTELLEQEFSLPYFEFVYDEPMEQ